MTAPIDPDTRYDDCPRTQYVATVHPEGLSHHRISELTGMSHMTVRNTERRAIRQFIRGMRLVGFSDAQIVELLREREAQRARAEMIRPEMWAAEVA